MRIGRLNQPQEFVFSLEKNLPSSSSSSTAPVDCSIDSEQQMIEIVSGTSTDGLGMNLASSLGNKFYFDVLSSYDGTPQQMLLYVSGTQVALVTFNSPYLGTKFVFERNVGGASVLYCGTIVSGDVNLND